MKSTEYIEKMKRIQDKILTFIESKENSETNFDNLKKVLIDQKTRENLHDLKSFLHLLIKITNNHRHAPNFFSKIEQIIQLFKDDIKKTFSNSEIFNIFKSNKRILLFLIEEKVMDIDDHIATTIINDKFTRPKYSDYFSPELKSRLSSESLPSEEHDNFEEKRKIGENDSCICELIREDSIDEFTSHVEKTNLKISSNIEKSIFETNSFLNKNHPTLIEYAAFCGSINIFKYLFTNKAEVNHSIWIYAIHGQNLDLIHFLEENHLEPEDKTYEKCFIESIRCHHNEIANYIRDSLLKKEDINLSVIDKFCYQFYNFEYINDDSIDESFVYDFCRFGYYQLVYQILGNIEIDVNALYIQKKP
ncbi:hypothetical protein M9Y10_020685 [Tritrichomonas musculus]|uniref:DUF3447 domain-containing protein n=1 Tax=Tritrichomonas musculus TaxID=1915356 RepID=A0ABR2HEA7_9EUKA